MRLQITLLTLFTLLYASVMAPTGNAAKTKEQKPALTVYTERKSHLIDPVLKAYEKETGTKVNTVTGKAEALIEKLKAEGKNTPADLLITVDAGNLWYASQQDLFTPIESKTLQENIPSYLRSPDNKWYGLSLRARTIVFNKNKVKPSELSDYASLADPKWNDRLCLRTSKKVYNQSLVAMLIAEYGKEKTQKIVKGWVDNLAAPVFTSDTQLIEAIAAGQCDVGIVNTYYLGRKLKENKDYPVALFWADQNGDGVHVNISGAGVIKNSKHTKEAKALLEWLSSEEAQEKFADANLEFPVKPEVKANPIVKSWGEFKESKVNVSKAGELQQEAVKLMDKAGYK